MLNEIKAPTVGFIAIVLVAVVMFAVSTKANPLEFLLQNNGSTVSATTTVTYLTAGTATSTTNVYDTYANGNGNTYATNNLALEVQFTASSTSSTLNWYYEYAQGTAGANCVNTPASCDWYTDDTFQNASSSQQAISVVNPIKYSWTFASSTQGGGAPTGAISNKVFLVNPVARYVRAVFTLPAGSTAGAVWAAFIGQKQASN